MDCQKAQELLAAYALSGSFDEESPLLLEHVRSCAICQRVLQEDHEVLARLALMEPGQMVTPHPGLFDKILERIGSYEGALPRGRQAPFVPRGNPFSLRFLVPRPAFAFVVAPLVFLVVGLGVVAIFLAARVGQAEREAQAIAAQSEDQRTLLRLAAAPDVARLDLLGTGETPRAWGRLIFEPSKQEAAFLGVNLPPPPSGQVYQLWLISEDWRADGGTFTVASDGTVEVLVRAPWAMGNCKAAGVTLEPLGGSKEPTGPRVLRGERAGAFQGW